MSARQRRPLPHILPDSAVILYETSYFLADYPSLIWRYGMRGSDEEREGKEREFSFILGWEPLEKHVVTSSRSLPFCPLLKSSMYMHESWHTSQSFSFLFGPHLNLHSLAFLHFRSLPRTYPKEQWNDAFFHSGPTQTLCRAQTHSSSYPIYLAFLRIFIHI